LNTLGDVELDLSYMKLQGHCVSDPGLLGCSHACHDHIKYPAISQTTCTLILPTVPRFAKSTLYRVRFIAIFRPFQVMPQLYPTAIWIYCAARSKARPRARNHNYQASLMQCLEYRTRASDVLYGTMVSRLVSFIYRQYRRLCSQAGQNGEPSEVYNSAVHSRRLS